MDSLRKHTKSNIAIYLPLGGPVSSNGEALESEDHIPSQSVEKNPLALKKSFLHAQLHTHVDY